MSRNLRLAHLPSGHPKLRFSGHLTADATDAQVVEKLAPFLINTTLWRSAASLPPDWPRADDSEVSDPGSNPVWGQGDLVAAGTVIGDAETPWRLLVGQGQLVIDNLWLLDPGADPWPEPVVCPACPGAAACPPATGIATERLVAVPVSGSCDRVTPAAVAAIVGAVAGAAGAVYWNR